jgi:light-regulated signal transduction histidine kinase (bacteriophytochrome)
MSEAIQADLTACENEPIHAPGSIQPFGVLLAFDANTLTVRNASENSRKMLGLGAADPHGSSAASLLGSAAEKTLREALAKDGLADHRPIPVSVNNGEASAWHGVAHCLGSMVFVELEPAEAVTRSLADALAAVLVSVRRLSTAATIADFGATVAREFHALTDYDRVMVYRFDAEWNGEVVAEERRSDMEPFLGLHYPASDIPAQARAMFLVNRIRVIPDAGYEPIPVVPNRDGNGLPLDLSRCLLRSVSPVHCEYLHNMGVAASLTASLIVGGRLWGMIACHHTKPRRPSPAEREACDLLAQVASAHLAFLAEVEDRDYLAFLSDALRRIGTRVGMSAPPIAALAKDQSDLLTAVGALGAVVWRSGRGISVGRTPPPEALLELLDWIKGVASPLLATDRLAQEYAPAKKFSDVASGLLALEVSRETDEYLVWFRPEVLQTMNWGGDPRDKSQVNGHIGPRRSFALWKETVRERSIPWRPAELENARRIKDLLLAAASVSAARLEGYLPICSWCKKVRDEPGYWRAVEEFVADHVDVRFTHGVCPECLKTQLAAFSNLQAGQRPLF